MCSCVHSSVMVIPKGLLGIFWNGTLQPHLCYDWPHPQYALYYVHNSVPHKVTIFSITLGEKICILVTTDPLSGVKIKILKKKIFRDEAAGTRIIQMSCKLFFITSGALRQRRAKCRNSLHKLNQSLQQSKFDSLTECCIFKNRPFLKIQSVSSESMKFVQYLHDIDPRKVYAFICCPFLFCHWEMKS